MGILKKIRLLYFDESADTLARFMELCSENPYVEIVGAFHTFSEAEEIFGEGILQLINRFSVDVAVIKVFELYSEYYAYVKTISPVIKTVGLLSGACAKDLSFTSIFDYYISTNDKDSLITDESVFSRLLYKIRTARLKSELSGKNWAILPKPLSKAPFRSVQVIAIGASAGGTEALTKILAALPTDLPPIVIVQHMPDSFTDFFTRNLATRISLKLCVATGGERLENGYAYIAGYNKHLEIKRDDNGDLYCSCTQGEKVSGHRPSVDLLFSSVAKSAAYKAVGVILTGMGNDGARGLLEMRNNGAYTIGQDKETCAVYGMPLAAYEIGAVCKQLPLDFIADEIVTLARNGRRNETK